MSRRRSAAEAWLLLAVLLAPSSNAHAWELTPAQMERLVRDVTAAQNAATAPSADLEDVERLYDLYTPDFVYEHPMMDDVYTRERLRNNHLAALEKGRFEGPGAAGHAYRIVGMMHGDNATAVQRINARMGDRAPRMAVFEFSDGKVSRIREYWNY
ncbi:nuclear transport factor 2 family protein [Marilutibacter chinensis]|uniref:Nuclear transport factor 2 family protein n=1 Tax=Marilutibacter chinensis TaxID=2912247 RepID=A0ABS9HNQ3_9GAMM|nr:nuclear transport factor 2 family protein [Lysobacter chinensis]MCF7220619.1 nuclear transport factor 2 family protein [Lysobacter chinensis]